MPASLGGMGPPGRPEAGSAVSRMSFPGRRSVASAACPSALFPMIGADSAGGALEQNPIGWNRPIG